MRDKVRATLAGLAGSRIVCALSGGGDSVALLHCLLALRETDWGKVAAAATVLKKVDVRVDDNPMLSVADMNAKCRRLDDLGLVVIDYLQLMTSA